MNTLFGNSDSCCKRDKGVKGLNKTKVSLIVIDEATDKIKHNRTIYWLIGMNSLFFI